VCSTVRDAEAPAALFPEHLLDLVRRPHEELALDTLAVGILRGVIASAIRGAHLAHQIVEGLPRHVAVRLVTGTPIDLEIERQELGVVVEHLLEVWHEPLLVDRVAVKSAPEVIVDAAARHAREHALDHVERALVFTHVGVGQQGLEVGRIRELRLL